MPLPHNATMATAAALERRRRQRHRQTTIPLLRLATFLLPSLLHFPIIICGVEASGEGGGGKLYVSFSDGQAPLRDVAATHFDALHVAPHRSAVGEQALPHDKLPRSGDATLSGMIASA